MLGFDAINNTMVSYLQQLDNAAKQRKLNKLSSDSFEWYMNSVKNIGSAKARSALMTASQEEKFFTGKTVIGKLYTFVYDAKHKDTLPYWDAAPCGFFIGPSKNNANFFMLNLHYLSPRYRAALLDKLVEFANDRKYTANNKLNLTYSLLKASSELTMFKPCLHQYIPGRLGSRIVEIPVKYWAPVIFLPLADFQGASNSKVWSDSALKG